MPSFHAFKFVVTLVTSNYKIVFLFFDMCFERMRDERKDRGDEHRQGKEEDNASREGEMLYVVTEEIHFKDTNCTVNVWDIDIHGNHFCKTQIAE